MSKYIGFFRHHTELEIRDINSYESNYVTPISFTVTVEADSLDEAIKILKDGYIESENVGAYDIEFKALVFNWSNYSLEAVTQFLY